METDWEDYYQILKVKPDAPPEEIAANYRQLSALYENLVTMYPQVPEYLQGMTAVTEAYKVLSDPTQRQDYDQIRLGNETAETESEFNDTIAQVAEQVQKSKKIWNSPHWPRISARGMRIGALSVMAVLLVLMAGTVLAFARPNQALAAPFRSAAMAMARTSAGAIGLIEDVRAVVASYERNIISTTLQSMRVDRGLPRLAPVAIPTNDMANFPSAEYPLYPLYLDKQYSAFRYTVDSYGNVQVDKSTAVTDALLNRIKEAIETLEAAAH